MAVSDLRTDQIPAGQLQYDVCLIGAGAAGISIAQALAGSRFSICLLESGSGSAEAETQRLYEGEVAGHSMTMDTGRYRVLGGSTSRWTGRCGKLDAIDFQARAWVPHSGWPIGLEDLEPYYEAARAVCGFRRAWQDDSLAASALGLEPITDPRLRNFIWRYAPLGSRLYRNWGVEYDAVLKSAENIDAVLHANVTRWHAPAGGKRVEAVTVSTLEGKQAVIKANLFVLCAGGLESARLLLSSAEDVPGGLGAAMPMVGRFFMQHPRGSIGRLHTNASAAKVLQDRLAIFATRMGLQYESGFALSAKEQQESELLNASVILTYEADPDCGWEAFKELAGIAPDEGARGYGRSGAALRLARDPGSAVSNLWRRGWQKRHAAFPVRGIDLVIDLEQKPDPESRVTLCDDRDRLGMRRARVAWRVNEEERRTSLRFAEILSDHFEATGIGHVEKADWLFDQGSIGDELSGTYHHIATLRMSEGPESGVVDANCQVHGVDNLFVASCATFSTGGHVNPTFTIVALALRLADHIRDRLVGERAGRRDERGLEDRCEQFADGEQAPGQGAHQTAWQKTNFSQ
ncbi:hypothetical protein GR702_02925 [Novosphingobium sp. FGD1]|uniref:Glucose-methanol-choline oxidoreductase C-terminal domain-containing protein n=1 Tax=Novosphingobium silvae TaxID=2692619 RepID=A0A7X4K6A8_9SPHN|nr:GMC family oxidoreductase [Novosphingobium silvae]MYL96727.1 hypothetical protein [Novosphingobium silvae]